MRAKKSVAIRRAIDDYGSEILANPHMEIERHSLQHGTVTTYDHSLRVARLSVRIALFFHVWAHVDRSSLVRAALLHDYFLYDWHDSEPWHRLHGFRHGGFAVRNAQRDFELTAIESNAIARHMFPLTPIPPKYLEGVIVSVADKISATQETLSPQRFRTLHIAHMIGVIHTRFTHQGFHS
ncbi:MAG: HD domain-containing protein [Bifidobacteriaceae bacterium]|jgi:uncharacterized protein|nr:HD domain-containing protein [Bifidobacteriaceae bacterium]